MTNWDKIWDEQGGARGGVPEPSFVRFANRAFNRSLHHIRFLDIGSGTGANTLWLEQRGADVVSIDPSHACRAHYHEELVEFWSGYVDECWEIDAFDCIMDIKTLCHNEDAAADYERIHELLKPGGWLYVMAPTIKHLNVEGGYRQVGAGKSFTRFASEWDMRDMLKMFSTVTIRELLEPAGDHLYTSTWCCEAQK